MTAMEIDLACTYAWALYGRLLHLLGTGGTPADARRVVEQERDMLTVALEANPELRDGLADVSEMMFFEVTRRN